MASRPVLPPFSVITSGDMSAATITSAVTILTNISMLSYGLSWAGTSPVGTAAVQVSNDYSLNADGTVRNAGTWNTVTLTYGGNSVTSVPVTGNTGSGFIEVDLTSAHAIRLLYTKTSGVGTLNVVAAGKVS